ncbi:MAG TPA: ABC transporter permease [Blastocatellia bacterium]|nr:ABC transporter permease [Blastocatellia bacterium]
MQTILQDLRYGVRLLIKSPGFTLVAGLTLSLAIGVNTAVFSIVNAVLIKPLPYQDSDRLVAVYEKRLTQGSLRNLAAPADFYTWQEENQVFESLAAYTEAHFNLTGDGEPERFWGLNATRELFSVLGTKPVLGRDFEPADGRGADSQVAIISYGLWQRRFGGVSDIAGKTIALNGTPHTIVGVMPRGFQFPSKKIDIWTLTDSGPEARANRRFRYFVGIGRLKPGITLSQARSAMEQIAAGLERRFPGTNSGRSVSLFSLRDEMTRTVRPALLILLATVSLVLLIGCANLANLQLARAAAREKEMAIRSALGASRWRTVRQLFTESLLLSAMGGIAGLIVAFWGIGLLDGLIPSSIAEFNPSGLDWRILSFTAGISLLTGVLSGLLPGIQVSRQSVSVFLKESGRSAGSSPRHNRTRNVLVVTEIALALMLLIGAGLLIKSFARLLDVNPGFQTRNVVAMDFSLNARQYHERTRSVMFIEALTQTLRSVPGVESTGVTSHLPLSGEEGNRSFTIGRQSATNSEKSDAEYRVVSPDYFRTMGIPLHSGRLFTSYDTFNPEAKDNPPHVVIVNEAFARRFLSGQNLLGQPIVIDDGMNRVRELVGVVGDVNHFGLDISPYPEMYVPFAQMPRATLTMVVRTSDNPELFVGGVRRAVSQLDPNLPLYNVKSVDGYLSESVAGRRLNMLLLAVFAALAMVLAVVGIYAVMSFAVTQRTHEIGIRTALGASPKEVFTLVVGQGMKLALTGIAIGLAAAFALTTAMKGLLFGISATDSATFVALPFLFLGIAFLACYVPARRAMRVDPIAALRDE